MASEQCPNPTDLSAFVSGSIAEDAAEGLALHLDTCIVCQQKVDTFARQGDSLLQNLRGATPPRSAENGSVIDKLMEQAEVLVAVRPRETLNAASPESRTTNSGPVSIGRFLHELRHSGLMDAEEIDEALATIPTREVQSLALELVNQDRLTRYQAGLLARGKSKGLVLGNYEVLDKVGEGGMGLVFKARHKRMDRIVALKVLPTASMKSEVSVRRFRREVRTAAKLNHENIVLAHDADEAEGVHFLVMEYVDGQDLSRIVKTQGALSVEHAIQCVEQAARALQYSHELGIVHRDIKPQNLLIDNRGTVKVLDLGLARPEGDDDAHLSSDLTNSGVVMGTLDYIAPEQAANSKKADARSDMYSLGCTMYFLLTGRRMYGGDSPVEKLLAHREDPIPDLLAFRSDVPMSLEAVFRRMVAKRAEDRYQTMAELIADLDSISSGHDAHVEPLIAEETIIDSGPLRIDAGTTNDLPTSPLDFPTEPFVVQDTFIDTETLPAFPQIPAWATANQKRQRWRIDRRMLWIVCGTVAGLLLLASIIAALPKLAGLVADNNLFSTIGETATVKSNGANNQNLIENGGNGRVLIVVPRNHFWHPDYKNVREEFDRRQVQLVVATVDGSDAIPEQKDQGPLKPTVALKDANSSDYDAVVFCGAQDMSEFKHCKHTARFIRAMQGDNRCVSTICRGQLALESAGIKVEPLSACVVESGNFVYAKGPQDAAQFAKSVMKQIHAKKSRGKSS